MTDRLFDVKPDPFGPRWTPFPGPGVELWGCGPEGAECGNCKWYKDRCIPVCAQVAEVPGRPAVTRKRHAACQKFVRKDE